MDTSGIAELLHRHEFFAGLEEESLEFIAGCCTNVRFAAGEYVFHEGEPADTFYVLRSGRVAIEAGAPARSPLVIDTVDKGDILGFSWLSPPYLCQFDARALETTRATCFDAACLRNKCDEDPRLGYVLLQRLTVVMRQRLQSARIRLLDLYSPVSAG